jgi:hypothetical protein
MYYLRNANSGGFADVTFQFGYGNSGWLTIVGDWNGDGKDTIGQYNPATSMFYLRNSNSRGEADLTFIYGDGGAGWLPIAGDWNNDGKDTVALYNPTDSLFFLKNTNTTGYADVTFCYGPAKADWTPIAGDWNGNGTTTIGLYDPTTSVFYLRDTNTTGYADLTFCYGDADSGWTPLVGVWTKTSTLLAVEDAAPATTAASELTKAALDSVVEEAIQRWVAAGLNSDGIAKLQQVQINVADLSGSRLGETTANTITIDRDAAGHGWFVDSTLATDEEFTAGSSNLSAKEHMDLLTVVEHELGHVLGLNDLDASLNDLMSATLSDGVRREISVSDVDAVFAIYGS